MLLHILWLILKFILIVLGVILGLVLLAVLLVLFCPVRYRAAAEKKGERNFRESSASFRVSWLFHLLIFDGVFENRAVHYRIRIFGIPLDFLQKLLKGRGKKKSRAGERAEKTPAPKAVRPPEEISRGEETRQPEEVPRGEETGQPEVVSRAEELVQPEELSQREEPGHAEALSQKEEEKQPEIIHPREEPPNQNAHEWKPSKWETIKNILTAPVRLWKKLAAAVKGFFGKIRKIALTIRKLYDKMNWWKEFFGHPRVQEALSLVWGDAKKLLCHVMPTKTEGSIVFGCEDPAVTGSILAFLGMSIPLHKNRIQVTPLFDGGNYLEGYVKLKGRIYGWIFVKTALEIYFNKNVKYVISRWKHKEA